MSRGYFRNVDDAQSDPENIVARYLVGHNAALEVALTLEELAENIKSASGGQGGALNAIILTETGGNPTGGGGNPTGGVCPEISQRLITKEGYWDCGKIYDKYTDVSLFNPLTGNFNRIVDLKIVDSPIVEIVTQRARLLCSTSHKVIKNTSDLNGTWFGAADEVLVYTDNCYIDTILDVIQKPDSQVLQIELEKEFIYVAEGVCSHNRKNLDN